MNERYAEILRAYLSGPYGEGAGEHAQALARVRAASRLQSAAPFYDLLAEGGRLPSDRPVVGYFCNLVPDELIAACGAHPVRLCSADAGLARCGEKLVPGDVCPVIKSVAGGLLQGLAEKLDLIVVPAACDGKIKAAELLSPFREVYFLDIPRDGDYLRNSAIWEERYGQFHAFLRKRYGIGRDRKALRAACDAANERTAAFRELFELRARTPGAVDAYDYFIASYASFFMDAAEWARGTKSLTAEARAGSVAPKGRKRLLLAGSPVLFPSFKLLYILDECGCDVAADVLCSAYGRLYDPVQVDEETEKGVIRALALKHVAASMCPCLLGMDKLLDRMVEIVREYGLDGVLFHNLRLCQVFEIQAVAMRQVLKAMKIPLLVIQTDLGQEDRGQIKTRVEAFLEMLG